MSTGSVGAPKTCIGAARSRIAREVLAPSGKTMLHLDGLSVRPPARDAYLVEDLSLAKPRNPRHFDTIEGGRVYQALHIEPKSVLDALRRVKKCLRRSM